MPTISGLLLLATVFAATAAPATQAADTERGEQIYQRCIACHSLDRNRSGPKHCGLLGRRAGSLPDYAYSRAMAGSGIIWTEETLDRFLKDPLGTLPGTKMGYAGVKNAQERADLVAWLARVSQDRSICP